MGYDLSSILWRQLEAMVYTYIPQLYMNAITSPCLEPYPGLAYLCWHYGDVIMDAIASQITSLIIVYSIVYSDADQRKHHSFASLAVVWWIHRGPVNSPHKWPGTRKCFHLMTSSWVKQTAECVICTAIKCALLICDNFKLSVWFAVLVVNLTERIWCTEQGLDSNSNSRWCFLLVVHSDG